MLTKNAKTSFSKKNCKFFFEKKEGGQRLSQRRKGVKDFLTPFLQKNDFFLKKFRQKLNQLPRKLQKPKNLFTRFQFRRTTADCWQKTVKQDLLLEKKTRFNSVLGSSTRFERSCSPPLQQTRPRATEPGDRHRQGFNGSSLDCLLFPH